MFSDKDKRNVGITRNRGRTTFIFLKVIKLKCRLITVFYLTNETGWLNV